MAEKAQAVQRAEVVATLKTVKLESLSDRMNEILDAVTHRAYEVFESNGSLHGRDLDDWFQAERELLQPVQLSVSETDQALVARAEVVGFDEKDLTVGVGPNRLMIVGKRGTREKVGSTNDSCAEGSLNQILHMVDLPAEVDPEKVTAKLKNGILELKMPKKMEVRS